jgi:hypothetical protein
MKSGVRSQPDMQWISNPPPDQNRQAVELTRETQNEELVRRVSHAQNDGVGGEWRGLQHQESNQRRGAVDQD